MKVHIKRHVRGLVAEAIIAHAPNNKRVQVFVRSYRDGFYYPQAVPYLDAEQGTKRLHARVVLGDEGYPFGLYGVIAVALDTEARWDPVDELPTGTRSRMIRVVRTGITR